MREGLNLLAGLIRGKPVQKALIELEFNRRRVSNEVKKVLESAIANAEHNDGADIDEETVKAYVRDNLARYKVPREVVFLDELPRNPTGKVLKRDLAAWTD